MGKGNRDKDGEKENRGKRKGLKNHFEIVSNMLH